jgi:hypothetical protein
MCGFVAPGQLWKWLLDFLSRSGAYGGKSIGERATSTELQ